MAYIYPQFSSKELFGIRLGGAGLGNLLFTWARAELLAAEHNLQVIWPSWKSLKLGPWIRNEADKRFYGDLFQNNSGYVDGIKKAGVLLLGNKVKINQVTSFAELGENDVVLYDAFDMHFKDLLPHRDYLRQIITANLQKKGMAALAFDAQKAINVHVRLGDFAAANAGALAAGQNNTRIPVGWYAAMVKELRKYIGECRVNVFSDGTDEELTELLRLPNVHRVFFGNSIADILALSKAPLIISSGSSFSLWARFLGNCSSISYPNQKKDATFTGETGFELELPMDGCLTPEQVQLLQQMYNSRD